MTIDIRNRRVKDYFDGKLNQAENQSIDKFYKLTDFKEVEQILIDLIFVKTMGFRGIVATAIAGQLINPDYNPLNDFYGCSPRPIYENGIFNSFHGRIPCGKSDPLNVAKNTTKLDSWWVQGKRPKAAAQAVVDFLTLLEKRPNEREILIDFYFYKLVEYANTVTSIKANIPDSNSLSKLELSDKIVDFTLQYPESGTIPQKVIALLLEENFKGSESLVKGASESVFGTNTTSKKPADIWVEKDNKVMSLFEVTVKKVDNKRLIDAIESIASLDLLSLPLTFICRVPEDIKGLNIPCRDCNISTTYSYKGKRIDFVDISAFIRITCSIISESSMQEVVNKLAVFVGEIDRAVATKEGWNSIFKPTL